MRQRNIKNLDERIEENARLLITDPRSCKGNWAEIFGKPDLSGNRMRKRKFYRSSCHRGKE